MRRTVFTGRVALLLAVASAAPGADGSDRLYPVARGGKWGYIDRSGVVVIEPRYAAALSYSSGLAPVRVAQGRDAKWGYIDRTGEVVMEPKYEAAEGLRTGVAEVKSGDLAGYICPEGHMAGQRAKY